MTEVVSAVAPLVMDGGVGAERSDARVDDVLVSAVTSAASAGVPTKDVDADDGKKLEGIQERVRLEESADVDAFKAGNAPGRDVESSVIEKTKDVNVDVPAPVTGNADVNEGVAVPPVQEDAKQVQEQETGVALSTTIGTATDEVKKEKDEEVSSGDVKITESVASPETALEANGGMPSTESEVATKVVVPAHQEPQTENQVELAKVEEENIDHDGAGSAEPIANAGGVTESSTKEVNEEEKAKAAEPAIEEAQGEARSEEPAQESLVKEGTLTNDEAAQKPVESDTPAQEPVPSVPKTGEETEPAIDSTSVPEVQQVVEPLQEPSIKEEAAATDNDERILVEADTPAQDPPSSEPTIETVAKPVDVVEPAPDVQPAQTEELAKENPSKAEELIAVEEPVDLAASAEAPVQIDAPTSVDTPAEHPASEVNEGAEITEGAPVVGSEPVATTDEASAPLPISETEEKPVTLADATQETETRPMEAELVKVGEPTMVEEAEAPAIQKAGTDKDQEKLLDVVTEPVAKETTEAEVKPQEAEVSSELPKEGEKSSKDEQPVEVVEPVTAEEHVVDEQSAPAESSAAEPAESGAGQEIIVEATDKSEAAVETQPVNPPEQQEQVDRGDGAARRAYELTHEHSNDEVKFDSPTEEEMRAANLEDVILGSREVTSDVVAEPVAKETTEAEVKPQEVEASSELPKEGDESSKDEQPVEVVEPVTTEEDVVIEQPVPAEASLAESVARPEVIIEATDKSETAIETQPVNPPEQHDKVDTGDDAARRAPELAHEHPNDEVKSDSPTGEEMRAESLEAIVPESTVAGGAAPEILASTPKVDTKEESVSIPPASESGIESLSNIPLDSGDVPSASVATVPSVSTSEEAGKRDEKVEAEVSEGPLVSEVQPEKESEAIPDVTPTKAEVASTDDVSTEKFSEDAKPETVVVEEVGSADVVAPASAEPVDAAEPAIKAQEGENVAVLDALKETAETAGAALSVGVPSDEVLVSGSEGGKEVANEATSIPTDKIGEPAKLAQDTPIEPVADVLADVPAVNDVVESKEEPSVATVSPAANELVGPTDVVQEVAVLEPSQVETREEVPANVDVAKDSLQEEVKDEQKQPEDLVPAADAAVDVTVADEVTVPADVTQEVFESEPHLQAKEPGELLLTKETAKDVPQEGVKGEQELTEGLIPTVVAEAGVAAPTPEPASQEAIATEEVPASDEPVATETNGLTKEDGNQGTPTTEAHAPKVEESSTDTPVPPASTGELTDTPADESAGTGIAEPAATPASFVTTGHNDKAVRSGEDDTIEQVDELLKEGAEEAVAPAEELPGTERQPVVTGADAEVEPPVPAPGQEELVADAIPATSAEIVEEPIAKQDIEDISQNPLDEAKLVELTEGARLTVAQAQEPVETAPAVSEAPTAVPEGTEATLQTEVELDAASISATIESGTIVADEGTQEAAEAVPDVLVETPTPMSETLTESSDDDEGKSVPVELRLAKAVGILPEEVAGLPAISTSDSAPSEGGVTATEDEARTPTETKDEVIPDEVEVKEETLVTDSLELETPTQSVILEKIENEEGPAAAGLSVDTDVSEVPERPKSPWTPSYSVIQQGTSPVHPAEEPKEELVVETPAEVAAEEVVTEKVEEVTPEAIAPPSEQREPPLETTLAESAPAAQVPEPAVTEATVSEAKPSESEGTETLLMDLGREEPLTQTEVVQAQTSGEIEEVESEVLAEAAPSNLTVDTAAKEVPDRPKSPWTPSYSVTRLGSGVPEPEELHLDADVPASESKDVQPAPIEPLQQVVTENQEAALAPDVVVEATKAPESVQDAERPKSPYPIAYSVTQQGPGAVEETMPSAEFFESNPFEDTGSIVNSNEPEAPLTPRSELGAITPGFDSLSEVSDASHIPIPPDSPRTDPEVTSLTSVEANTPLVSGTEVQGESVSPIPTPVLSAQKALEVFDEAEPLTEFAVEGVSEDTTREKAGAPSASTESWIKETNDEKESYVDSDGPVTEISAEDNVAEKGVIHSEAADKETTEVVATSIIDEHSLEQEDVQNETRELPASTSTSELLIPKVDVASAHPAAPPVIVTNTLSTDSAFTQFSRTFSTSQETTATDITTPDVEAPPVSKFKRGGSEVESLDEETTVTHVSDEPRDSATATATSSPRGTHGKSLGIAHTLAMRSFPSAFAQTESPSTSEQPNQAPEFDNSELDDQLSQLSSSRRRVESTASALAFPGGWISSPPHVERASLEVAKGEFVKPIFEGKPISTSSPGVTSPSNEDDNEIKEEEKGSGWRCVIM